MRHFLAAAIVLVALLAHDTGRAQEGVDTAQSACAEGLGLAARLALGLGRCHGNRGPEGIIFGSAVGTPPLPSAVDTVLDTSRRHVSAEASTSNTSRDEATTLNAIALSRASGVTLGPRDVADETGSATRSLVWLNLLFPNAQTILNILTLGVTKIDATGFDVTYAGNFDAAAELTSTRRISDENTLAGLALLGGGVPLDPRLLIDTTDGLSERSRVGTFPGPSVPPSGADLAAQAAIAPIGGDVVPAVYAFSNRTVQYAQTAESTREVELPDSIALAGLALNNHGIPFDAADAISESTTDRLDREVTYQYERERAVLLYWLTLGLRFAPPLAVPP